MAYPAQDRLLLIGVGQEWRGDDAAGLLVARSLLDLAGPRVTILEQSGRAPDLLSTWQGAEAVILVDAVRSGGRPGEIHRFPVHREPLPAELFPSVSSHGWGVAQAVALGRTLGQLPSFLVIYGIEGHNFGLGRDLSPPVARTVPEVARRIRAEIKTCFVPPKYSQVGDDQD